jgi:sugar lactone lactonase YvrE
MHATRCRLRLVLIAGTALFLLPAAPLAAQDGDDPMTADDPAAGPLLLPDDGVVADHGHEPVDVAARPMVTRFALALIRPRRLLVEEDRVIVADWGAGTVVEVDPEGRASILATGLNEPAGLARDALGTLYVSTHGEGIGGEGAIIRLVPGSMPLPLVEGLTGPTDIAFGPDGYLYVAAFHENTVLRVAPEGGMVMAAASVPSPAALAFDPDGLLYVASSTDGAVFRVLPMGDIELVTRDLHMPSDLAFDPEGHLIVANYGTRELSYVDPRGRTRPFAVVPEGTIALDFDAEGNLLFVNWDGQYLMKVTTNLAVPCPHCGRPIPVRLREPPLHNAPEASDSSKPVI